MPPTPPGSRPTCARLGPSSAVSTGAAATRPADALRRLSSAGAALVAEDVPHDLEGRGRTGRAGALPTLHEVPHDVEQIVAARLLLVTHDQPAQRLEAVPPM